MQSGQGPYVMGFGAIGGDGLLVLQVIRGEGRGHPFQRGQTDG
jgi:hypothetical protein